MALISYTDGVNHLREQGILGSPVDTDLALKIEQASAIVLSHLKRFGEWDIDSDPTDDPEFAIVQAAVLRVLANLHRFRGDDEKSPSPISDDVVAMLSMMRDPSLA